MMTQLARIPLRYQPGTQFEYSIGPDVLARLVELLSGTSFDRFLHERIFEPLGMMDTGFWTAQPQRLATVHWSRDGVLVPCDEAYGCPTAESFLLRASNINSYTTEHAHKGGSYGLVGTAEDYWRFAQMMLNQGTLAGHRILSPRTVRYMTRDHLGTVTVPAADGGWSGVGWGLGFEITLNPATAGMIGSTGTYFWGGAAQTLFWIDPNEDLIVIGMTQHMMAPTAEWPTLMAQLRAMVYGALVN